MSDDAMVNAKGVAIDNEDILSWFEHVDLTQCLVTHAQAHGILRMRQRGEESGKRKRRKDADQPRTRKADEAPLLAFDPKDRP